MKKWEKALEKFIGKYKEKDYVIAAVLVGSYASGNQNEKSDIDVQIITTETGWKKRGNVIVDDIMIEYFMNPVSEIYKYMENDHNKRRRLSDAGMYVHGKVIFDKTGITQELKKKGLEYYEKDFPDPDETTIMINNYICWDLMNELEDKINNKENISFNYNLLLKELISNYYYKNKISTVPFAKIEKIFKDKNYRDKYHLKNYPDDEFVSLVLICFENETYVNIKKLYNYVIQDFKITDFELKTKV
ncbi:MAG: hypothetical protein GX951_05560 [Mollicutes bacterium]|nr:hypothetical protein [Mollicutes bacterium]